MSDNQELLEELHRAIHEEETLIENNNRSKLERTLKEMLIPLASRLCKDDNARQRACNDVSYAIPDIVEDTESLLIDLISMSNDREAAQE